MSEQGNTASQMTNLVDGFQRATGQGIHRAEFTGNPSDICTRPGCTHDRGSHLNGTGACGYCDCQAMETACGCWNATHLGRCIHIARVAEYPPADAYRRGPGYRGC